VRRFNAPLSLPSSAGTSERRQEVIAGAPGGRMTDRSPNDRPLGFDDAVRAALEP
jgi:hypothetical protein